jgi:hypothetical protein
MKFLTGVAIILLVFFCARALLNHWQEVRVKGDSAQTQSEPAAPAPQAAASLPGLPHHLEASLDAAKRQGPDALKTWLRQNRRQIQDPRLADIELDYVLAVAGKNFGEAKEVFAAVRERTATNSPVYPRIRKLERTYL